MDPTINTDGWLIFEDTGDNAAEYADFDEQVEMKPEDGAAHLEYVRRVADEYGFPIPDWTPSIPTRDGATHHGGS